MTWNALRTSPPPKSTDGNGQSGRPYNLLLEFLSTQDWLERFHLAAENRTLVSDASIFSMAQAQRQRYAGSADQKERDLLLRDFDQAIAFLRRARSATIQVAVQEWARSLPGVMWTLATDAEVDLDVIFEPEVALKGLTVPVFQALARLSVWGGPFDESGAAYLGIDGDMLASLSRRLFVAVTFDEDGDPWYTVPHYLQALLARNIDQDDAKRLHQQIARYLQQRAFDLFQALAERPAPIELIRMNDGGPVPEEAMNFILYTLTQRFVADVTTQTENVLLAEMVVSLAKDWHHHLLAAEEYNLAMGVAKALTQTLVRWGEADTAVGLIYATAERWEAREPDRAEAIDLEVAAFLGFPGASERYDEYIVSNIDPEMRQDYEKLKRLETPSKSSMLIEQGIELKEAGQLEGAAALFGRASETCEANDDVEGKALAQYHLSESLADLGLPSRALGTSQLAEELALQGNEHLLVSEILRSRARIYARYEQHAEAEKYLLQSIELSERIKDLRGKAEAQRMLGSQYLLQGECEQASELLRQSLAIARRFDAHAEIARTQFALGMADEALGNYTLALTELMEARALFPSVLPADPETLSLLDSYIASTRSAIHHSSSPAGGQIRTS